MKLILIQINFFFKNVKKISTKNKGQVFQRIEGFKLAKNDYVLQLDSDIRVSKFCLEHLYNRIKNKKISSVGPKLYDLKDEIYFSANTPKISDRLSIYEKLFLAFCLALNYVSGDMTSSETEFWNLTLEGEKKVRENYVVLSVV